MQPFWRVSPYSGGYQPSLDKKQVREIATGRFIADAEVVMLLGPPAPAS
jgi:hypothetical protein